MTDRFTGQTASLARQALELHRIALAADEASQLKSPTTPREHGDVSRPTEETALCPRRAHVRNTCQDLQVSLRVIENRLTRALDVWEGTTNP